MPKPDLFASIDALADKIIARLPPKAREKAQNLSPQQRQTTVIAGSGCLIFFVLWFVFSLLFGNGTAELDRSAFRPQTVNNGTGTAISAPDKKSFPEEKDALPPIAPAKSATQPSLKTILNLTPQQQMQIDRLRENVHHQYKNVLPFTLDEAKMVYFAQAAARIDRINMKWDTLIAGAATENLALEYLSSVNLEINALLDYSPGIVRSEYNEIYALSARDRKFNDIANAYKNLVAQGIWGPLAPIQEKNPAKVTDPSLRFPVAPPKASTPTPNPAAPAGPDTGPAPADSPVPPYSPPPAR